MTIPEFSIKRRITVFMVILIVCIFGIIAFFRLGLDMLPELEYPVVSVITTYQGVSSEDIEKLITRPVESVISTVKNVKRVNSTSQGGSRRSSSSLNGGRSSTLPPRTSAKNSPG